MMVRDVSQRRVSSSSIKEPNVIYFNIRSVITLVAGITALIIFTVVLFNVVAARFAYPPADSEPQPSPPSTTATANTPSTASSSTRNTLPPAAAPVLPAAAKLRKDFSEKGSHKKHQKAMKRRHITRRPPRHNEYPDENDASEPMQADAPMRQDSPDSALVDNYETWRDIMPEDSGPERRRRSECLLPQCRWLSRYLTSKLDWTIKPCHDFYAHVCSAKWFASEDESNQESMDFQTQSVARLMNELSLYLQKKASTLPWERNAAAFFTDCLMPKTPRTLSSIRPRFPIWPLEKITSLSTLPKLIAYVDKFFRSTPLLKTYVGQMRSSYSNDTLYVDSPVLPLARFQLLHPKAKEEDYKKLLRSTLQGHGVNNVPQAVVKLELALSRIISRDFVTLADRAVDTQNLLSGDMFWDPVLMALVGNRREVRALDHKYLMNLMSVLKNATSPLTVANLIIFSTLTQIAPLIHNMSSLTPLGLEQTVRGVPLQVQGCLSLTEKAYQSGMRILALKALGVTDWSPEKLKAGVIQKLVAELKKVLKKYVRTWFTESESKRDALRRLKKLRVNLLGATPHDELTYARDEKSFSNARHLVSLLEESPARNSTDYFFPGSVFSPAPKYVAETHTLYLPPAMFGLVNKLQQFDDPLLLLPLIGAPILQAMLSVVDARGTQTFLEGSVLATHWWSPTDDAKLSRIKACYRDLYALSLRDALINSNQQAFFEEFVAQGALLDPLHKLFKEKVAEYHPDGLRIEPEFTADMLFYIVYVMGLCEAPGAERYKVKHRMGIPSRILVNAHLGSSERFRRAFKCKHSDEMMPLRSCSYWDVH